jgi:hypothetical protein
MLAIDMETANNITRLNLTEYRDMMQDSLDRWNADAKDEDNPDGYWMHPDDVVHSMKQIKRINKVLHDFGGELYGERETREFSSSPTMVEASKGLEAYFLEIRKSAAKQED